MTRLFIAAVLLSCLSAFASAQTQPSPTQPPEAKAAKPAKPAAKKPVERHDPARNAASARTEPCGLGVITAVGDKFMVKKLGFITGDEKVVAIEGWGLDDLVFARVRAAVPNGVAVRRITYSKSVKPREELTSQFFRSRTAELVDVMRQITAGTSCERYVLIGRSISKFGGTSHTVGGIGIINWDNALKHNTYVFALSFIRVFDGRDFSIIRQGSAITEREPLMQRVLLGEVVLGPYSEVPQSSFPSQPDAAVNNLALREYARALLTASLDKTLPSMLRP